METGGGKKKKRWKRRIIVTVVIVVLAGVFVGVWIPASMTPAEYKPVTDLSAVQKENLSHKFVQNVVLDFRNQTQRGEPFVFTISEQRINEYLASLDEIAYVRMGSARGEVDRAMEKAGLAAPSVDLRAGGFTLMVKASKFSKVLSAGVEVSRIESGEIISRITDTRVGKLPVSSRIITSNIEKLYKKASARKITDDYARSWVQVLGALSAGKPITPEQIWKINSVKVAIDDIEITDDAFTLHVRPVRPVR